MIAPPPALLTDDQIVNYFAGAVEAVGEDVPWVLHDYPLTLTMVMTPGAIAKIVSIHHSRLRLKHEDWPGLEKDLDAPRLAEVGRIATLLHSLR
ncbi:hypothetical protein FHT76_006758 [Rhizobium sp. BK176]|nr:hypothetical protein [Rhizobium sp. BK181]MBB3542878.1 hypothetical protein [Rhizobium sp. BK399]MCS4095049.1 hypothetical protein [Rhizobium sp. BK176]